MKQLSQNQKDMLASLNQLQVTENMCLSRPIHTANIKTWNSLIRHGFMTEENQEFRGIPVVIGVLTQKGKAVAQAIEPDETN